MYLDVRVDERSAGNSPAEDCCWHPAKFRVNLLAMEQARFHSRGQCRGRNVGSVLWWLRARGRGGMTPCGAGGQSVQGLAAARVAVGAAVGRRAGARLGPFDFPLGFARGFGKNRQARGTPSPH